MTRTLFSRAILLITLALAGTPVVATTAFAAETPVSPWGAGFESVIVRARTGGGIYHVLPSDQAVTYNVQGPCTLTVYVRQIVEDYDLDVENADVAVTLDGHTLAQIVHYQGTDPNTEPAKAGTGGAVLGIPTEFTAGVYTVRLEGAHTFVMKVQRAENPVVARVTYKLIEPPPPQPPPVVASASPAPSPAPAPPAPTTLVGLPAASPEVQEAIREVLAEDAAKREKAEKPPKEREPREPKPESEPHPLDLEFTSWHLATMVGLDHYGPTFGLTVGGLVTGFHPNLTGRFYGGFGFTGDSAGEQALNQWQKGGFNPSLTLGTHLLLDPTKPSPPPPPTPGVPRLTEGSLNLPQVLLVPGGIEYRLLRFNEAAQHDLSVPLGLVVEVGDWASRLALTPGIYWGRVPRGEWIECQGGQVCPGPGSFPAQPKLGFEFELWAMP